MSTHVSYEKLYVTTLPDGADLHLPLHTLEGAKPGPTLGLSAALHGDEMLPGMAVIRRLLNELNPAEFSGRVVAVPICNPLGVAARMRHTPADGGNLNNAFHEPGYGGHVEPVRTVTEQIANVLTTRYLALLDYMIDFHSGGEDHAVCYCEFSDNPESQAMARAFGSPILLKTTFLPGRMWHVMEKRGGKAIVAQVGGGGQMFDDWVQRAIDGAYNVMRHLGMLPGEVTKPPRQHIVDITVGHEINLAMLRPTQSGLIMPDPAITPQRFFAGQPVEGVATLGRLVSPYDLTVRQTFEPLHRRTLLLASVVAPAWTYTGETAYMMADANAAEVVE